MDAAAAFRLDPRQPSVTARAPLDERVPHLEAARRAAARFPLQLLDERAFLSGGGGRVVSAGHRQITICETMPPTANAAIHVPIQMMNPSFNPRSFIMTMSDAM